MLTLNFLFTANLKLTNNLKTPKSLSYINTCVILTEIWTIKGGKRPRMEPQKNF